MKNHALIFLTASWTLALAACSSDPTPDPGTGGSTGLGGASSSGGATMGGSNGSGGASFGGAPPTQGGSPTSGGTTSSSGGTTSSSGGSSSGGSTAGGSANGGATSGGGTSTTSGGSATGGATTGGVTTSGGSGGAKSSGGATASGGSTNSGGKAGTGGAATGGTGGSSSGAKFHVFLLLGQSNMEGYPKAQQADRTEDPRVKVLGYDDCASTGRQKDKWDTAAPPLHSCWNDGLGPGDYFAKTLLPKYPASDTIGLVPCAINGEKIETFLKVGGAKYSWIVDRAKLAQQAGGVIEGMLFHQGESNNGDSTWPGKVNTLVKDLKTDLGLGNVPFVAGELLYSGSCAGHNTLINQLPNVVSNAFVVSASGLVVDPADTQYMLHFGHDSQVTFGKRYAEKMIEALHL